MLSKSFVQSHLATWKDLNRVMKAADLSTCEQFLEAEKQGKRRKQFLMRIHSRLNKVRADQERTSLLELVK